MKNLLTWKGKPFQLGHDFSVMDSSVPHGVKQEPLQFQLGHVFPDMDREV